mmetsp:Transcript_4226/g.11698  ORF Transcript_4226/g.11698 Transcript_4226/m.11698 type:complete len:755 (-) Transcript_4226:729-2993(-)
MEGCSWNVPNSARVDDKSGQWPWAGLEVEGHDEEELSEEDGRGLDFRTDSRHKPSPPMTAYDFFVRSVREVYTKTCSLDSFPPQLDRRIAHRWRDIENNAKAGYQRMAADDRARYSRQMREWNEEVTRDGENALEGKSKEGSLRDVVVQGRTIPRDKIQSAWKRRLPTKQSFRIQEDSIGNRPDAHSHETGYTKTQHGLASDNHPKRLNLAVVGADCPNLETEYIALDETSTLSEALHDMQNAARSEWPEEWRPEDGKGNELELLGVIVGRRQVRSPAEVPMGQGHKSANVVPWRRTASAESLLQGERFDSAKEEEGRSPEWESRGGGMMLGAGNSGSREEHVVEGQEDEAFASGDSFGDFDTEVDGRKQTGSAAGVNLNNTQEGADNKINGTAVATNDIDIVTATDTNKRKDAKLSVADAPPRKKRKVSRQMNNQFEEKLEELRRYQEKNGHCNVPLKTSALGGWVKRVRLSYKYLKSGNQEEAPAWCRALTDFDQVERLKALGFRFVLREQKERATFEDRLQEYIRAKEEVGDDDNDIQDKSVRTWMSYMRSEYSKRQRGKRSDLNDERIATLTKMGFVWNIHEENFSKRLEEFKVFKQRHGHLNITASLDKRLDVAAKRLREYYYRLKQGKPCPLTMERIQRLTDIGFQFDSTNAARLAEAADATHEKIMEEFTKFKEENGHCSISQTHPTMGGWVGRLRVKYRLRQQGKSSTLTDEHISELEGLGFNFDGDENLASLFPFPLDDIIHPTL